MSMLAITPRLSSVSRNRGSARGLMRPFVRPSWSLDVGFVVE